MNSGLSLLSIENEVQLKARLCQIALELETAYQRLDVDKEIFLTSQDYKVLITKGVIKLQFQTQLITPVEIFYMVNQLVRLRTDNERQNITVHLPLPDYRIPLMPEDLISEFEGNRKLPYLIIELGER